MVDSDDVNYCEACQSGEHLDLRPFFTFFGGKWRLALNYQPPKHDLIIEPFAGSAGYSVTYHRHRIVLIEKDPTIASIWEYLISSTPEDIMSLPLLKPGQLIRDLDVPLGAKCLMMYWTGYARHYPGIKLPIRSVNYPSRYWGDQVKSRIASQVNHIKHWVVINSDYSGVENFESTWFIDPPYVESGHRYKYKSTGIDYEYLAEFSSERRGQVIVCESSRADWLPFDHLITTQNCNNDSFSEGVLYL